MRENLPASSAPGSWIQAEGLDSALRTQLSEVFHQGVSVQTFNAQPIVRRPGSRHVFACEVALNDYGSGNTRSLQLIGKRDTTRAPGKADREFQALQLLWDAGFGADRRFRIPQPVLHCPKLQLILHSRVRGWKLRAFVGKGSTASLHHARMAGLWLAKLHKLRVPPQVCTYGNEILSLRRFLTALRVDLPDPAPELQAWAAETELKFLSFRDVPAAMVHGDFHPDHIFCREESITVIDWERFLIGDPARDLGSFIAHARIIACRSERALEAANQEIEAFLQAYLSALSSRQRVAIVPRIGPYVTLAGLEALYYVVSVLKVIDRNQIAAYLNCLRQSDRLAGDSALPSHAGLLQTGPKFLGEGPMTRAETRCDRKDWRERQQVLLGDTKFVLERVAPLLPETAASSRPLDGSVEIIRSKASDRITVRYMFGAVGTVYAKAYFDGPIGQAAYNLLVHLSKHGFAPGSGLEVPEPLGFIEEANLLLLPEAPGISLKELVSASPPEIVIEAIRGAARWLAKFHSAEIPGLPVQSPCESIEILKVADVIAKAAAENPDESATFIAMLHDLHAVAPKNNSSSRLAPSHGQFRAAHVFIIGSRVTVIDLEKVSLSDPAKDVARFVHGLKKTCFEEGGNAEYVDQLAQEFVCEYGRLAPSNLENFAYFRALLAFKALAKLLKSRKVNESERQAIGEMHRREFESTTRRNAIHLIAA